MIEIKVLDYGYLQLVESWGSEERVIEAARMSTGNGFKGWGPNHRPNCGYAGMPDDPQRGCTCDHKEPGDEKLLRFLYENNHATPFEMAGAIIDVQAPIFVFREWHRHRTQSYNEMSARYTPLPDVNYRPTIARCLTVNSVNKQASKAAGAEELTHDKALTWLERLDTAYALCQEVYAEGLKMGIPKELARLPVLVARYSRMRAGANLRNWLAFLTLREAPNAQSEIRQYANALHSVLAGIFPRTLALFEEKK